MVSKYLAYNEKVSVIYADTTDLVKYVKDIQNLTYLTTEIVGKFYTVSSLMALSDIKEESDEIKIQLNGDGLLGLLYSQVKLENSNVCIKGFSENPQLNLKDKDKKIDISSIIGKAGNLIIIKNNKYIKTGYKGIIPLVSGNIVDDFKCYYEKSTQKPAFIGLEIIQKDNEIKSGGYLITFMPDCTDEDISKVRENIVNDLFFHNLVNENKSSDEIAKCISGDSNIIKIEEDSKIIYKCDCNKEKYKDMLLTLKKQEVEQLLKEDGKINIVCDYCNKQYEFSKEELLDIIDKLK